MFTAKLAKTLGTDGKEHGRVSRALFDSLADQVLTL